MGGGWYRDYSCPDCSDISPSYPYLRISTIWMNAVGMWIQLSSCVILDSLPDWSQEVPCQCHSFCNWVQPVNVPKIVFALHPHFGYISSYVSQQWGQRNNLGLVFAIMKTKLDGQLLLVHFQHLSSLLLGSLLNPFMYRRWSTLHTESAVFCIGGGSSFWAVLFLIIYFQDVCSLLWVFCSTQFIMGEPTSSFLSHFSRKEIHQL